MEQRVEEERVGVCLLPPFSAFLFLHFDSCDIDSELHNIIYGRWVKEAYLGKLRKEGYFCCGTAGNKRQNTSQFTLLPNNVINV